MWEELDDDEKAQYQEKVLSARAEDEKNNVFIQDVPQVIGSKNQNKFNPHVGIIRAGALAT